MFVFRGDQFDIMHLNDNRIKIIMTKGKHINVAFLVTDYIIVQEVMVKQFRSNGK